MSLLGAFKRKQDASFNIEPAYEPETEAKGELDFVKGQAETAEEVIQAHLEEVKAKEAAAENAESIATEQAEAAENTDTVVSETPSDNETTAAAEKESTPAIVVPEYVPPRSLAAELEETMIPESEKIYQKVPVTQHEPVINLPEFHPSDEPAIALIRGDEGFLAKDLVSGLMAMGSCESDAKDRLITLLAQPA